MGQPRVLMEWTLCRELDCYYELTNQQSHNQCDGLLFSGRRCSLVSLGLDLAKWDHIFDLVGKTFIHFSMCLNKQLPMSSINGPWPHDRAFWSIAVPHTTTFGFSIHIIGLSWVFHYSYRSAQTQVKKAVRVTVGSKVPPLSLSSLSNLRNLRSLCARPFCHRWWLLAKRVAWHHHVCVLWCTKKPQHVEFEHGQGFLFNKWYYNLSSTYSAPSQMYPTPLLSEDELTLLKSLFADNPGLEVTPQILLQFIAEKTRASPPRSPNSDDDMQLLPMRGRGEERDDYGHYHRSSSNESNGAPYYRSSGSRASSRGPQTPNNPKSPFDAERRQRSTPLANNAPSSWSKRPAPAHRRKSDAGSRSDSQVSHFFNRYSSCRAHSPSYFYSPSVHQAPSTEAPADAFARHQTPLHPPHDPTT